MPAVLSKTRSVLDRLIANDKGAYFDFADDDFSRSRLTHLDAQSYRDLGEPEQITVTVEPGDTLTPIYYDAENEV